MDLSYVSQCLLRTDWEQAEEATFESVHTALAQISFPNPHTSPLAGRYLEWPSPERAPYLGLPLPTAPVATYDTHSIHSAQLRPSSRVTVREVPSESRYRTTGSLTTTSVALALCGVDTQRQPPRSEWMVEELTVGGALRVFGALPYKPQPKTRYDQALPERKQVKKEKGGGVASSGQEERSDRRSHWTEPAKRRGGQEYSGPAGRAGRVSPAMEEDDDKEENEEEVEEDEGLLPEPERETESAVTTYGRQYPLHMRLAALGTILQAKAAQFRRDEGACAARLGEVEAEIDELRAAVAAEEKRALYPTWPLESSGKNTMQARAATGRGFMAGTVKAEASKNKFARTAPAPRLAAGHKRGPLAGGDAASLAVTAPFRETLLEGLLAKLRKKLALLVLKHNAQLAATARRMLDQLQATERRAVLTDLFAAFRAHAGAQRGQAARGRKLRSHLMCHRVRAVVRCWRAKAVVGAARARRLWVALGAYVRLLQVRTTATASCWELGLYIELQQAKRFLSYRSVGRNTGYFRLGQ
jgi:hypothetical protein